MFSKANGGPGMAKGAATDNESEEDGRSWLDRELGLRRRREEPARKTPPVSTGLPTGQTGKEGLRRVLIVDDDEATTGIYRALLPGAKYVVSTAVTGEEGLERVRNWKPDLVILDYMLPGIDGVEVCSRIRNRFSNHGVKIMMVSGCSTLNDRVRGYGAGADDFLVKPVDVGVFCAKVNTMFEWARRERENGLPSAGVHAAIHVRVNCWEFKKCGRDLTGDCPAFVNRQGRMCWLVAGTMCGGTPQGTYAQKIKNCSLCDFFIALKGKSD